MTKLRLSTGLVKKDMLYSLKEKQVGRADFLKDYSLKEIYGKDCMMWMRKFF